MRRGCFDLDGFLLGISRFRSGGGVHVEIRRGREQSGEGWDASYDSQKCMRIISGRGLEMFGKSSRYIYLCACFFVR